MTGRLKDLTVNRDGTQNITVTVACDFTKAFDDLKDKDLSIEIKKAQKGRSISQNAFMWSLCSDIGKCLLPPLAKEDIYKRAIKAVGVYTQTQLLAWDIQKVQERWESHGTGWFLEVVDDVQGLVGHKTVNLYYGSSTYTTGEFKLLIDWLIDEADQCGVQIPAGKEREELYHEWGFC